LFNLLGRELRKTGWELSVVFASKMSKDRLFEIDLDECDFEYTILESKRIWLFGLKKEIFWFTGLLSYLKRLNPEKIVASGFSIGTLKIWASSLFRKYNYIIWCGTILSKPLANSFFVKFYRRVLASGAEGFIAYGSQAKKYFYSLGAREDKISIAINTVDTDFFRLKHNSTGTNHQNDKKHLCYIGYLTKGKNVMLLLRIVEQLMNRRNDFVLDIIGDGPEKEKLMQFVDSNGLSDFVIFHGFRQKQDLPFYLSQCDVFLFQTNLDIWGLVLNEAMAAGKVCLASVNAGAIHDLIDEGINGFSVDFRNTMEVTSRIEWILDNPDKATEIGKNAAFFIQEHAHLRNSVEGFIHHLKARQS